MNHVEIKCAFARVTPRCRVEDSRLHGNDKKAGQGVLCRAWGCSEKMPAVAGMTVPLVMLGLVGSALMTFWPMVAVMADEPGTDADQGYEIYNGHKEMDELPRLADAPAPADDVIVPAYSPPRDRVILRGVEPAAGWRMARATPMPVHDQPYVVRDVAMVDAMATPVPVRSVRRTALLGSGFYAGVSVGKSQGKAGFTHAGTCNTATYDSSKRFGQVQAGYMAHYGNWRLGPELTLQLGGNMEADAVCPVGSSSCHSKVEDLATLGLRAGYMLGPVMPYAVVGAATGKVSSQVGTCTGVTTGGKCKPTTTTYTASQASGSDWRSGLMYGAGVEGFVLPRLSVRAEWGKAELESSRINVSGKTIDVDNDVEMVKVGANFHF